MQSCRALAEPAKRETTEIWPERSLDFLDTDDARIGRYNLELFTVRTFAPKLNVDLCTNTDVNQVGWTLAADEVCDLKLLLDDFR